MLKSDQKLIFWFFVLLTLPHQIHNKYRKQILNGEIEMLPQAKVMKELQWDETLQNEAQR